MNMTRVYLQRFAVAAALVLAPACEDDEGPNPVDGAGGIGGAGGGSDARDAAGGSSGSGGTDAGGDVLASDGGDMAAAPPPDTDLALVRFTANGMLDTTFGTGGIVRVDLGGQAGSTRDSLQGFARDAMDRLVLFASKKADGRNDADRVVVRLSAAGARDTAFGTMGAHTLDVMNLGDSARNGVVQADGKIVASGYTAQPTGAGTQMANKVVLLRLLDNGTADGTFGMNGVVSSLPFAIDPTTQMFGMAEAYGVALQGDKYVTTGYGRSAPAGQVDLVAFRYTAAGALDTTWGVNGIVTLDIAGDNDRGRNVIALPDGRVLAVGTGSKALNTEDAMVAIHSANGALDASFDTDGYKLWEFGGTDEEFYGVAVAPNNNWVAASGYTAAMGQDDDSTLLLLPINAAAGGAEIAKAVPLSATANDRLWGVTFDAAGKAVAAGFINEGGDNQMVVARFNTDGNLDTSFGTGGWTKVNVSAAKTEETARGVVVQSDGKIVIAGVAEHL